ncbi:glycosyltransferase [Marinobacter sp. NP-6]|uniref:glycosyltransferase n=1 Tax=Marinobacter sp. NP-6 TaxID=2488666 RepID=UPI000FCCA79D|nr:glycosyltransferase [Marinobacter sp. NP-6]RUT75289.1 glycosyltransferase [Marinobacter sp. NP-6]
MKIVSVLEEGKLGGPQIYLINLVVGGVEFSDDNLFLIPRDNSNNFQEKLKQKGIRFRLLPLTRITKEKLVALRYILFFPLEIVLLAISFRRHRADIIYVAGGSWQFKGILASKLARIPVLWHLNDTSMPAFILWIFRALSRFGDGFIFASNRSKHYYEPLISNDRPRFVIPSSVDTRVFCRGYVSRSFSDEVIPSHWEGKVVVGLVGNPSPVKGIEVFIRMAAEVNSKIANVQFAILGNVFSNQQRYFDSLQALIIKLGIDNVDFLGGCDDVRPFLERFDIYVCSSLSESSPISVWEAMAMELPVVSTDVGDVPEYVRDGECGYICPVGDHKSLARHVCELVVDEPMRKRLGKSARAKVVSELDVRACAEKHFEAYRAVLRAN